jgi:Prenyltransferase and squalene oxidase repeat
MTQEENRKHGDHLNPQLIEKCKQSADAAINWLLRQLQDDGSYGPAINDLASYYKSPYLFYMSGRSEAARRMLTYIKQEFMQANGDFKTSVDIKSENGAFVEYWAYTNGWIALAAQKMGCFDIAYPAYRYLRSFYHEKNGGFTTRRPYGDSDNIVDVLTTAHLGLAALYFGEIEKAARAGKLLQRFIDMQPDLRSGFYLRMNDQGEIINDYPQDAAIFHQVSALKPNQAYFMIGYPIGFLGKLHRATGASEYLDAALRYLDFAMGCRESIRSFHFSHKVAWAAAVVAGLTGETKYSDFSKKIVDYLLSIQDAGGAWLKDEPAHTSFDQTAEIAIWLREIVMELA